MKPTANEAPAVRREILVARAALQRLQFTAAAGQARSDLASPLRLGALAVRLAGAWAAPPQGPPYRPLLLSAGWLLARVVRVSPTARWLAAAGAAGVAIWWIARAAHSAPVDGEDRSG